jgi:hypothetical protein
MSTYLQLKDENTGLKKRDKKSWRVIIVRLPKRCRKNKPSKYAPVYESWTWKQIYVHIIWPYSLEEIRMLAGICGEKFD